MIHRKHLRNKNNLNNQTTMELTRFRAKGVFLDLDGTIVDSTEAYIKAAEIAFQALKKPVPETSILLKIPKRIEQRLSIEDITGNCTQKFLPIYLDAYHSITEKKTKLLPNMASALEKLSKKSKLALITIRYVPNQVIQKELDYLGIDRYFSHIVTSLDISKPKPSPEALIRCVEVLDLDMCDCLIAGDSVLDVRAGKAAGAKTVGVLSGLYGRAELEKECPNLVLPDITALPCYIE
jgi:HAD superfamily hydrolase (TIGR01509 family)